MSYRHGYARVSTTAQDPQLQHDALAGAGIDRVYVAAASGVTRRPGLDLLLENARPGDTIVIRPAIEEGVCDDAPSPHNGDEGNGGSP